MLAGDARAEDIKDIPVGLKILGEDLLLFCDDRGRLGLLGLHCAQRDSSLEYGDIEFGCFTGIRKQWARRPDAVEHSATSALPVKTKCTAKEHSTDIARSSS
jgi:hypothetical protein